MIQLSDDKLKLTIRPARQNSLSGVPLAKNSGFRSTLQTFNRRIKKITDSVRQDTSPLSMACRIIQTRLIDGSYQDTIPQINQDFILEGPHQSRLSLDVFLPGKSKPTQQDEFQYRVWLKLQRTLLNLESLIQAYPEALGLNELKNQLEMIDCNTPAERLHRELMHLIKTPGFRQYLLMKESFLTDWVGQESREHAQMDFTPLKTSDLQNIIKALLAQNQSRSGTDPVLRYTEDRFFRYFNGQRHPLVCSGSHGFWGTPEIEQGFHDLIGGIQRCYGAQVPFHVFRFKNSFTYFLCGFADSDVQEAHLSQQDVVPVHAKILMRQMDRSYRELVADDSSDHYLYLQSLKRAMRPFIDDLNHRLDLNLPEAFLHFFEE